MCFSFIFISHYQVKFISHYQVTTSKQFGPVNAHLIQTVLLVGELITHDLGRGLYGPQGYVAEVTKRITLNCYSHMVKALGLMV